MHGGRRLEALFLLGCGLIVGCDGNIGGAGFGEETAIDEDLESSDNALLGGAGSEATVTASGLNLRTGPGTGYSVREVMYRGAIVQLLGPRSGTFAQVEHNGRTGWASMTYLAARAGHPDAGVATIDAGQVPSPTIDAGVIDAGQTSSGGPWDPRSGPPPAKGLWIWYFDYTGYTAAQAAQRAQADGIGYVLIKSGQDATFWSNRYNASVVREFTSRGIAVFAWPYVTPDDISGSVRAAVLAAQVPGTSGVILDVEIEWEESGHHQQALDLCNGIRRGAPNVFLGYTSFGWVGYHAALPFSAFDQACGDVFMPQVYWTDRGVSWTSGYNQAIQMIAAAHLTAPTWVIQSNDATPSGGRASTSDLNAFFDRAGPTSSLWEFPAAGHATLVNQLADLHWAN